MNSTLHLSKKFRGHLTQNILFSFLGITLIHNPFAHSQTFFPTRPSFNNHQKRIKHGPRKPLEYFLLSRVGLCINDQVKSPFISEELARKAVLQCSDTPKKDKQLLGSEHIEQFQKLPTLTKYLETKDSSALSPQDLRVLKSSWSLASFIGEHDSAEKLADALSALPAPKRTKERILLSHLKESFLARQGPFQSKSEEIIDQIEQLVHISKHALGEQVRAQALKLLSIWHPYEQIREDMDKELWLNYPQTVYGQVQTSHLDFMDWMNRGEAAFHSRDYQKTIHALQHYSPLGEEIHFVEPPSLEFRHRHLASEFEDLTQKSALLISISLMRLREYPEESERQLRIAETGPDSQIRARALFYQTHLLSRLKRWDESLAKLKAFLQTHPKGRQGREARYQVGRILHQAGRYDEAIKAFRNFIATKPKDPNMYTWFLGWSYYRKGDCVGAQKVWKKLKKNKNLVVGPKARYWSARCHLENGHERKALRELKLQLKQSPLGYYALLAQSLKAEILNQPFKWKNPLRRHRKRHWRKAAPSVPLKTLKRLKRSRYGKELAQKLSNILELVALGEEATARLKANELCLGKSNQKKLKKILGSKTVYQLCHQLEFYTGNHGKPWKRQASKRVAWLVGFHKRSIAERVGAYPLAYYDLSQAAAEVEELSPWWLMAHMLQESRYRPDVVSYAQAIGLLQILRRTGKRIREALSWPHGPFFSDQLYDPALSIRYAAWYLHHLYEDLGHPLLAIGAYNGGPMRFADHQELFEGQDFAVMVEEMGAHESRNYLRKVADHFIRYLALYGTQKEWEEWTQRLQPPKITPQPKRIVGF